MCVTNKYKPENLNTFVYGILELNVKKDKNI